MCAAPVLLSSESYNSHAPDPVNLVLFLALQFIPGLTKNGAQETPEFLKELLGVTTDPDEKVAPTDQAELDEELASVRAAAAQEEEAAAAPVDIDEEPVAGTEEGG